MERREPEASWGKMWQRLAVLGSSGSRSRAVWLEAMVLPFGMKTWSGGEAGWRLVTGALVIRQWLVQPVPAMMLCEREEGREGAVTYWFACDVSSTRGLAARELFCGRGALSPIVGAIPLSQRGVR
jgi:hypothetical protein